jgi:hypothetical protein
MSFDRTFNIRKGKDTMNPQLHSESAFFAEYFMIDNRQPEVYKITNESAYSKR